MECKKHIGLSLLCLLLVAALALAGCDTPPEQTEPPQETEWTPIYIPANLHELDSAAFITYSYAETRYEELRPEQLAMILPRERPQWMNAQGYTSFYWGKLGLDAYYTQINLQLATRLSGYDIHLTADVITQEMLDLMGGATDPYRNIPEHIKDQFFSVCHGVKFLIYEYVDEIYEVSDFVTLEAIARINNCQCKFVMNVPKGDAELLQQAKADFEQVLECYMRDRQWLDWHGIVPRFSNEYDIKELTYEEALTDNTYGDYVEQIWLWEGMMFYKFKRHTFYKSDELEIVFTDGEDTVEFTFEGLYGYGYEDPIEPGQQTQWSTPVYAAEDVTEELLRSCLTEDSGYETGIRFSNKLLWIEGPERYAPWIYEQITRIAKRVG